MSILTFLFYLFLVLKIALNNFFAGLVFSVFIGGRAMGSIVVSNNIHFQSSEILQLTLLKNNQYRH